MSLRLKTILGVALIEAALLLILILSVVGHMRTSIQDGLREYANTTASLFATTTKDAVISFDLASIETFAEEVMKNNDVMYARVLDGNGNLLTQRTDSNYIPRSFIEDLEPRDVIDSVYDTYKDIKEGGDLYGRVEVGISVLRVEHEIRKVRNLAVSIAVIELVIVMLYSFMLGVYLTNQLEALREGARAIRKGDFKHRIKIVSKDEVAEVATSFNRMSAVLQKNAKARIKYQKELKQLNTELEQRVQRRTQQIEEKNKKLEKTLDTLAKARDQLVQSEKMASIGQLAAGVAHEINNPIGFVSSNIGTLHDYIGSYTQLIERYENLIKTLDPNTEQKKIIQGIQKYKKDEDIEFLNEDVNELIKDSLDGIGRVTTIVKSLKTFSHVDQEEFSEADINQCLESTLKIVNNEIKYNCKVVTDLGKLPPLKCNPGQLNQVFMNLIVNASHAIETQGTITITSKATDKAIVISIADTGKGIPKKNLDKLFDPFFTTKPVGKGTGLGLSISHGIIKDHNGTIEIDSIVGKGTTFTITLPIQDTHK